MNNTLKKVTTLLLIPAVVNSAIAVYVFVTSGNGDFKGYIIGTVLSILLSYLWIWQIRKGIELNFIVLLKRTFWGFLIKLIVLFVVMFGGYKLILFNKFYFAFAFLLGSLLCVIIEIWYYLSIIKSDRDEN